MSAPSNTAPVRLQFGADAITLQWADGRRAALAVGADALASEVFRHDPPTGAELEHAIDVVEDALMAARLAPMDTRGLVVSAPSLRAVIGADGASRDEIEAAFQRLASHALGTPFAPHELPAGRAGAAALLILRECMHHLGFDRVAFANE